MYIYEFFTPRFLFSYIDEFINEGLSAKDSVLGNVCCSVTGWFLNLRWRFLYEVTAGQVHGYFHEIGSYEIVNSQKLVKVKALWKEMDFTEHVYVLYRVYLYLWSAVSRTKVKQIITDSTYNLLIVTQ